MDDARPYGRRAFLGLLAGGISALWWAGPANRVLAPISSQFSQLAGNLFPVGGWRISLAVHKHVVWQRWDEDLGMAVNLAQPPLRAGEDVHTGITPHLPFGSLPKRIS